MIKHNSSQNLPCGHKAPTRKIESPVRFLDKRNKYTLEEVLDLPIILDAMPYEYNPNSPTPLDPYSVKVRGVGYVGISLDFMMGELEQNTSELTSGHREQIEYAEAEIFHQHTRRVRSSADAMGRWREIASSGESKYLTNEDAEGVMQVRAGISKPTPRLELLARNPELDGLELGKATHPFCINAHMVARSIFKKDLIASQRASLVSERDARPYRYTIDGHNNALIIKTKLGTAALHGQRLEIVIRESGILYNPKEIEPIPESVDSKLGPFATLDFTGYVRVARD